MSEEFKPMAAHAPDYSDLDKLAVAEKEQVSLIFQQIDIADGNAVLQYGAAPQQQMAEFSQKALENVRTKELGEMGEQISKLIGELKALDTSGNQGFFSKLFGGAKNRIEVMKSKYGKAEKSVDSIVNVLEDHQITLMKDIAVLDQMFDQNKQNFRELSLYIIAGKQKLEEIRTQVIPALQEKAAQSGEAEDAQAANDMINFCDRFERKIHDLDLTRTVSLQMAPQIRMVQSNDTAMAEKIQSTLNNTIPLWKNQMLIALGIEHSAQAAEAQRKVTDMTNELLRSNAEKLKTASINTAEQVQRGVVDVETLQTTNKLLIETLDSVAAIQEQGRENRRLAEIELRKIEGELKANLTRFRG